MSTYAIPADLRLAQHIEVKPGPDGCWLWTGAKSSQGGYPGFTVNGQFVYAHRASFEMSYGRIPAGWHCHHTCGGSRLCVRPDHLEAIPAEEHRRRHAIQSARDRAERSKFWKRLMDMGMSLQSIADTTGYAVGTVRRYVFDAKRAELALAEAA